MEATYIRLDYNPKGQGTSYICRKGFPAVSVQLACTADRRIIDVSACWPSSMPERRIFRNSYLGRNLNDLLRGEKQLHLIADGDYNLELHVMIPYRRDQPLEEVRFCK